MKGLYLQDFQVMGAVFQPEAVLSANKNKVILRGRLCIEDKDFYVEILARKNLPVEITRLFAHDSAAAEHSLDALLSIWRKYFQDEQSALYLLAKKRQKRKAQWLLLLLACCLTTLFMLLVTMRMNFLLVDCIFCIISFMLFLYVIFDRNALLQNRSSLFKSRR